MIGALTAGLLAGYGVAIPVGAVGAYLVTLTARTTLRTGVCAALGVATADGLYALIATLGGAVLSHVLQPVMAPLRWVSAAVLVTLALRGGITAVNRYRHRHAVGDAGQSQQAAHQSSPSPIRAYLSLLGITMLNPATVIYFAALVFGGRSTELPDPIDRGAFVLAAFAASASWQVFMAGSGNLLGRVLTGDRGRLGTALVSAVLVTALAVRLLIPGL